MATRRIVALIVVLGLGGPTWGEDAPATMPPQPVPTPAWDASTVAPAGSVPAGSPYVYPECPDPARGCVVGAEPVAAVCAQRWTESSWYTRVDYFHWNERLDGADFVNESGTLVSLGYVRRVGPERFRAELFGGNVHYDGSALFDDGSTEPLSSTTGYLGVRGEYDLLIEPDWWPQASFLLGIGTRFWVRDLKDGVGDMGSPVIGYQETWWTIYPYLGLEKRRRLDGGPELYGSSRIGFTPITYERSLDDVALYPKAGLMGQLEGGIRGRHLFLSGYVEAMSWRESAVVRDTFQPYSQTYTVGLKTGLSF